MSFVLQLLMSLVLPVFQQIANNLWDLFWENLFAAISEAEAQWPDSGKGKEKRDWVVQQIASFVAEHAKAQGKQLSWLDQRIVLIFAGFTVDAVVKYINSALGNDWRAKAEELERKWAAALPVIS